MRRILLAVLAAFVTLVGPAHAETWPAHPITIVVPFAAGGPSDAMARILAERMKQSLGEVVLIENVTGAGGSLGVGRAVRAAPDGYTVSFGHLGTHVANGAIYKLGYDLVDDLEPVVLLPSNPMIIVSKNTVPAKSLKELLAWLQSLPAPPPAGPARPRPGTPIAGGGLEYLAGLQQQIVPDRGTGA
ncbi:MAG: tripartite tricarboxylate transporter substrate-binding protein, partial [Bradyrhizobium sp.]|uniref:tripartite tricarboxylate transporter substrate-binding protein n=1 Tax=Bradyrhizobium sp. TaxID=376 RepID=UPI00391A7C19